MSSASVGPAAGPGDSAPATPPTTPPTTASATRRGRRRLVRVLAVVVVLVIVVGVVVASILRAARATDGVRPGQLWEKGGSLGLDYAFTLDYQLPVGELVVKLATPVDTVPSSDAPPGLVPPGDEVHSGSEAAFVPIGWTLQGSSSASTAPAVPDAPQYQFQVSVLDGDQRYDLHAGSSSQSPASASEPVVTTKAMTLVVAGDGGGLVVEVTYDGLTQRGFVGGDDIDPGVAAPLYDSSRPDGYSAAGGCRLFTAAQARVLQTAAFGCELGAVRMLPYVAGLGWVKDPEESWAVVDVRVDGEGAIERTGRGPGAGTYRVTRRPLRVEVDRHRPVAVLAPHVDGLTRQATYVFRTTPVPRTLQVVARFDARRGAGPGARRLTFGAGARLPLS